MSGQRISVIVPTWRRPEHLRRCLVALAGQERPADEVVVVTRTDDEASRAVIGEAAPSGTRTVAPDGAGLLPAIRSGIAAARGNIIAVTDDDAEPEPRWLGQLEARFVPGVAAVGGRVLEVGADRSPDASAARVGRLSWLGHVTGRHMASRTGPALRVDHLQGCNMAFAAPAPAPDAHLRGAGHFYELGMSLEAGRRGAVVFDPSLVVRHHLGDRVAEADGAVQERSSLDPASVAAASYNLAYLLARHTTGRARRVARLGYIMLVGQRLVWGVGRSAAHAVLGPERTLAPGLLAVALRAKGSGWRAGSRARRADA